jgi:hypothetical protein
VPLAVAYVIAGVLAIVFGLSLYVELLVGYRIARQNGKRSALIFVVGTIALLAAYFGLITIAR